VPVANAVFVCCR